MITRNRAAEIRLLQTWSFEDIGGFDWSPDSSLIAAGRSKHVQLIEVYFGEVGSKLAGPQDKDIPYSFQGPVAFNPDGTRIAAGGIFSAWILEWDTSTGEPTTELIAVGANINAINYSPGGDELAVANSAGAFTLHPHEESAWVDYANSRGLDIVYHPTHPRLAVLDESKGVTVWPIKGNAPLLELESSSLDIAFSPDGTHIASPRKLWNASTGQLAAEFEYDESADGYWYLDFHPEGGLLAVGAGNGSIVLFDTDNFQIVRIIDQHSARIRAIKFSPDGKLLAATSDDGSLSLWGIGE